MIETTLFFDALRAGLYAALMAVVFTAPQRYLLRTFLCGLAVRMVRDFCVAGGMNMSWATLVAAAAAALAAAAVAPDRAVQPVVIVASVLQLSAATAVFDVIVQLLRISTAEGQELLDASLRLNASLGQAFTRFLAIAVGLQLGIGFARLAGGRRQAQARVAPD